MQALLVLMKGTVSAAAAACVCVCGFFFLLQTGNVAAVRVVAAGGGM